MIESLDKTGYVRLKVDEFFSQPATLRKAKIPKQMFIVEFLSHKMSKYVVATLSTFNCQLLTNRRRICVRNSVVRPFGDLFVNPTTVFCNVHVDSGHVW